MMSTRQNHHVGLKRNTSEKMNRAPATPPMAAVWVEIFHQTLMSAHTIWMMSALKTMLRMK